MDLYQKRIFDMQFGGLAMASSARWQQSLN